MQDWRYAKAVSGKIGLEPGMVDVGEKIESREDKSEPSMAASCLLVTVEFRSWRMLEVRLSGLKEVLEAAEEVIVAALLVLVFLGVVVVLVRLLAVLCGFSKLSTRPSREPPTSPLPPLEFSRGECESCNILI